MHVKCLFFENLPYYIYKIIFAICEYRNHYYYYYHYYYTELKYLLVSKTDHDNEIVLVGQKTTVIFQT